MTKSAPVKRSASVKKSVSLKRSSSTKKSLPSQRSLDSKNRARGILNKWVKEGIVPQRVIDRIESKEGMDNMIRGLILVEIMNSNLQHRDMGDRTQRFLGYIYDKIQMAKDTNVDLSWQAYLCNEYFRTGGYVEKTFLLREAVKLGYPELVKYILKNTNVKLHNKIDYSHVCKGPYWVSSFYDHDWLLINDAPNQKMLKYLLDNLPKKPSKKELETTLLLALKKENYDIASFLVNKGVLLSDKDITPAIKQGILLNDNLQNRFSKILQNLASKDKTKASHKTLQKAIRENDYFLVKKILVSDRIEPKAYKTYSVKRVDKDVFSSKIRNLVNNYYRPPRSSKSPGGFGYAKESITTQVPLHRRSSIKRRRSATPAKSNSPKSIKQKSV